MTTEYKEQIFVYGASGHAKVVIDAVEQQNRYEVVCLVDDDPDLKGQLFFDYRVVGGRADFLSMTNRPKRGIVAIGDNMTRRSVSTFLIEQGIGFITVVHPSAQIGRDTSVGCGTVIMAGVVINSGSRVGSGVVVNSRASIDHDCDIRCFAHVAPGSTLCGGVIVGEEAFIGAGATVIPNQTIGDRAIIAAGATVISRLADNVKVAGVPAREI